MESRMKNPAFVLNDVMPHMLAITKVVNSSGLPHKLLELIRARSLGARRMCDPHG